MDPLKIIGKYYDKKSRTYKLLVQHAEAVASKAEEVAKRVPEFSPDLKFIREAAMLHDIGIADTIAPGIGCNGHEPYIKHGVMGGGILRDEELEKHARVAERHLGTGISSKDIQMNGLPLPFENFVPETVEEEIICFADKFYSLRSGKTELRTLEEIREVLGEISQDCVREFNEWCKKFREV